MANALSPVKPLRVELREEDHTAIVTVAERQLSLAIGKDGQNARLAAKLTGWRVDVTKPAEGEVFEESELQEVSSSSGRRSGRDNGSRRGGGRERNDRGGHRQNRRDDYDRE